MEENDDIQSELYLKIKISQSWPIQSKTNSKKEQKNMAVSTANTGSLFDPAPGFTNSTND